MRIESARYEGNKLLLSLPIRQDVIEFAKCFTPGEYSVEVYREKRSLNANAYCWKLIGEISRKTGATPEAVYRRALEVFGGSIAERVAVPEKRADSFQRAWCSGHIGRRVVETESRLKGCRVFYIFIGSSDFDKSQMSILIQELHETCRELGIKIETAERTEKLLEAWDERTD